MKVLITGGSGMVGKNLIETHSAGHEILSPASSELNLLNYEEVEAFLMESQPDLIIHAAGIVGGIQANMADPIKFLIENLDIGKNIISAARKAGVDKLINLGSSCIYPKGRELSLKESDILAGQLEPTNEGYALAKIFALKYCQYVSDTSEELSYKTLIPCNLYGRWDKFSADKAHMIPAVIAKIHNAKINNLPTVDLWGDGTARREFMYAGDLADFVWFAVDNFDQIPIVMNVGLGTDYSINEYYEAIKNIVGFKGQFEHDFTKPVGMKRKLVDIERLQALGWKPKFKLEDGISETYNFFLNTYDTE